MSRSPSWPIGYPLGDVVAIMASPADADDAATMLQVLGIPGTSIEFVRRAAGPDRAPAGS